VSCAFPLLLKECNLFLELPTGNAEFPVGDTAAIVPSAGDISEIEKLFCDRAMPHRPARPHGV
jgi:hypothetical protein